MKKIEVVAGVIFWNDFVLCVQRPKNKYPYISEKFEFPGGKIEEGETQIEALKRELMEELNFTPRIKSFFLTVVHEYPDFEITMYSYICEVDSKELILKEHIDQKWLKINDLNTLNWAAADLPIVNKLRLNE
jgi:8-oxo-dGTP diphosphatase